MPLCDHFGRNWQEQGPRSARIRFSEAYSLGCANVRRKRRSGRPGCWEYEYFPVPKDLVIFVFGRFAFGTVVARLALHSEPISKAVDAWRSRLSGRGIDYGGGDFCPSQASGVDVSKDVMNLSLKTDKIPMRLRARRERMPSGRAARPRPRAFLGF